MPEGSPSVVQNVLVLVFDILLIELFWGLGAFDLILDLQMLPHIIVWFDQNPQTSKKKNPTTQSIFSYFSDILVLL